jgi:hypothetical protein
LESRINFGEPTYHGCLTLHKNVLPPGLCEALLKNLMLRYQFDPQHCKKEKKKKADEAPQLADFVATLL